MAGTSSAEAATRLSQSTPMSRSRKLVAISANRYVVCACVCLRERERERERKREIERACVCESEKSMSIKLAFEVFFFTEFGKDIRLSRI